MGSPGSGRLTMAGITLAQAEARLAEYMAAETAVLERGQAYRIADRELTRADLKEIRDGITYWQNQVDRLTRGGIRVRLGTPP